VRQQNIRKVVENLRKAEADGADLINDDDAVRELRYGVFMAAVMYFYSQ
jgi:hypothetical protein